MAAPLPIPYLMSFGDGDCLGWLFKGALDGVWGGGGVTC